MMTLSINVGKPKVIAVNGAEELTGFYKRPVKEPVFLGKLGIEGDVVVDNKNHGGLDKACYVFGFNHYAAWVNRFPVADAGFGLFGENITLDVLKESEVRLGDVYRLGDAIVQVTQPRQPCYKLGVRFNDQSVVRFFRLSDSPGIYLRVLQEGLICSGQSLELLERYSSAPSVVKMFRLLYDPNPDLNALTYILKLPFLPQNLFNYLSEKFGIR